MDIRGTGYTRCGSFVPVSVRKRTKKELEESNIQEWTVKVAIIGKIERARIEREITKW